MTVDSTDPPAAVVPAVGAGNSVTAVRSLGRRGVRTLVAADRPNRPSTTSRYCHETVRVPDPETDLWGYRDALVDLAARPGVRTVLPMREVDVYLLARERETVAAHVDPVWPTLEALRAVHDRRRLYAAAERAGVAVPTSVPLTAVTDWDRPRVVKARYALLTPDYPDDGPSDQVASPPKTIYLEPGERPDVDAIVERMGHVPLAQDYLAGTEYCSRHLVADGREVAASGKRLVRGYKYPRGPSVAHEATADDALLSAGRSLVTELGLDGIASVGFVRDANGVDRLLEVNPRFPASLPMDVHAGVDYPWYWYQLATGETPSPGSLRAGRRTHLLRGEVAHLHSVLTETYPLATKPSLAGTVAAQAASVLTHPAFDLLSATDPGPFLRDLRNAAGSVLSRG